MDLIERQHVDARRHPWEVARADFYLRVLDRSGALAGTVRVLDAGAGDGYVAERLQQLLPAGSAVVCWDSNYGAEDLADTPGGVERTAARPNGRFDGILLLDVIEHVEDDVAFVRDLVESSLVPGGWVLVGVPAYQALFSSHDRALRHFRRYSPSALRRVLRDAGLRVDASGGLFHALLPVRAAMVAAERLRLREVPGEGVGGWQGSDRRTRALTAALDWEGRASLALSARRIGRLPGLSTWAMCRATPGGRP